MIALVAPKCAANDASKAGAHASRVVTFGEFSRFGAFAVHTRFGAVSWFVQDVERLDDLGFPVVVRQEPTFEAAVRGLA